MVIHIMNTNLVLPDNLDSMEQNIKPIEAIKDQRTCIFYNNTLVKIVIALCFTLFVVFIVNISTITLP